MIAIRMVIPLLLEPPRLHHGRYWDPMETARLRRLATPDLTAVEVATIRSIMDDAFGSDENERFRMRMFVCTPISSTCSMPRDR